MKKSKRKLKKNPVAKNMYNGETGFKRQTQTHKSKKKYDRKKGKAIERLYPGNL